MARGSLVLPKTGDLLLGKYRLEKRLGEGGMGIVYAARHDLLDRRVAVKLIRPQYAMHAQAVARFLNEARAAARIENEHVARVLDVGTLENGLPYMVLEYLDGADLSSVLTERGPLPVADLADYLLEAIEALAHAHALGIVHRDLKPSNLFLARRPDGTSHVKVLDFGIAKVLGGEMPAASMTQTNTALGSPHYMSPEQLLNSKNVDHRCDVWALGVVAYELLTGRPPFDADNPVALYAAIQRAAPASVRVSRADVDVELDAIIMTCLRNRAEDRFSSVTELAMSLARFGTGVAAAALENTKRILPLGASPPARTEGSKPGLDRGTTFSAPKLGLGDDPGEEEAVVSSTLLEKRPVDTAHPWSSSRPDAGPKRRGRRVAVLALAGVAAAALIVLRVWTPHRPAADGIGAAALFHGPTSVALDAAGNIAVADYYSERIRIVTPAGNVTTLAGSGVEAFADGTGALAAFSLPSGVAFDAAKNVFVADLRNQRIRVVTPAGVVTTLAGSDTAGFADAAGASARFYNPQGVALDTANNVYVADSGNNRIRKVTPAGVVTTLAGSGDPDFADGAGSGASFNTPAAVATDPKGNVYVADAANNRIRKVTPLGVVTTLAGSGAQGYADGTGVEAVFDYPAGVALDTAGSIYVADYVNCVIRKVTPAGVVTTLAGSGAMAFADGPGATAAFDRPNGVTVDAAGNIYVADYLNNRIRKVAPLGIGQLAVTWLPPGAAGGAAITGYTASARADGQPTQSCTTTGATFCTIRGLTRTVKYSVSVTASNAGGPGAPSASATATPD